MPRPMFRGFRGPFLREKREEKKWTQERLAVVVDVFPTVVGTWERGEVVPDPGNVARLAAALQVRPQDFTEVPPEDGSMTDLRVWACLTRSQAARQSGISERRLLAFEHVTTRPDEESAAVLARLYGVTPDVVLGAWDRDRAAAYPKELAKQ